MKKTLFTGSAVALITPMHEDGSVNYEKLEELIEFQIAGHTDCILICGTTGESATFTADEYEKVVGFTYEKVAHRVPVMAGAGSNNTAHALELTKIASSIGVDSLLQVTPYYNKTSQAGLIKHFTTIADATDIPICLYNVPSRTGVTIQPQTFAQLCKHPNIVAVKDAANDFSATAKTMALCGDDLTFYSGNDDVVVPLMSMGAKGVISVLSNVAPQQTHDITQLCLDGDYAKAAKLMLQFLPVMNALFSDVNPIPVKEALNLMGYGVGECRLPLVPMSDTGREALANELKKAGLMK